MGHSMTLYIQNVNGKQNKQTPFTKIKNVLHETYEKVAKTSDNIYNQLKEVCKDTLNETKNFYSKVKDKIYKIFN